MTSSPGPWQDRPTLSSLPGRQEACDAAPPSNSPWQPADDWTLLVGLEVSVHDRDKIIDRGTVEVVTGDGAVLWLQQDGPILRRVIEKIPGRNLRVENFPPQR